MGNYWTGLEAKRLSRRRAIAATGAVAAAAALLAACGGGGDSGGESGETGLLTNAVDTTKQAKRGGIMKSRSHGDPPTLDIFTANNPHNAINHAYSALMRNKPYLKGGEATLAGDLVESFERSTDGLQLTLKIRQGVKWHNKPPVNGRTFDMEDVLFSWERFATKGGSRAGVANSANPEAPVLSVTGPDARTVVIKLKEPIIYALGLFTSSSSGGIVMIPQETDTTFNISNDMIGTGGFYLSDYTPSVSFTFKRHPEYWDPDFALVDQIDLPMVTEYAQAIAQLKAGAMFSFGHYNALARINAEDILPVKREEPRLLIYEGDPRSPAPSSGTVTNFGWQPAGKSPFLDERVRQAMSMAIDRDLYLDTFDNKKTFAAEGLPITSSWNSALQYGAGNESWWLDPKGKDFGPNARYFQHDPAEAKKLLAAAGYPNGFESYSNYVTGPQLPSSVHAEVIDGFFREIGVQSTVQAIDYSKEYIPRFRDGKGQYEGWAYKSSSGGPPSGGEAIGELTVHYWSQSALWHGFEDKQVDSMIERGRVEPDTEKRRAIVFDIQRHLAKTVYALQPPGSSSTFVMAWPCLGNFNTFRGTKAHERLWVDDTKAPFRTA
jgi:peptide/nickel transport system substrate-binding protein